MEIRIEVGPSGPVCDFCASVPVVKTYAAHPFVFMKSQPVEHHSDEGWSACKRCAELIDAEEWDKLTDRAVSLFKARHSIPRGDVPSVREQLRKIHAAFRENMIRES